MLTCENSWRTDSAQPIAGARQRALWRAPRSGKHGEASWSSNLEGAAADKPKGDGGRERAAKQAVGGLL